MATSAPFGAGAQAQGVMEDTTFGQIHGSESLHTREKSDDNTLDGPGFSQDSSDDGEKVHELARTFTLQSIKNAAGEVVNPFQGGDNPQLDPNSEKFNYKLWVKNLIGVQSRDPERYPARVAGISYKNLSAHGFGEATDYQKTFGNYPLEAAGLFKRLIGKREQRKIQILRNFDGLVRSGEMLVVLGRPGRFVARHLPQHLPLHKRMLANATVLQWMFDPTQNNLGRDRWILRGQGFSDQLPRYSYGDDA